MTMPGQLMAREILEQPTVLARILGEHDTHLAPVIRRLRSHDTRAALLVARGTSDHAALYAKYLIETRLGLPCGLVSTSTYTGYGVQPSLDGVVWIAVSQSGGSPDLVTSTQMARSAGALTICLTNTETNPLSDVSELSLPMLAGPELSVAATKTYTASLLWLWLLVHGWADQPTREAAAVPNWVAEALDRPEVDEVASRYRFVERLVATSRGYGYPTARESALKLMETCYLAAHAFSGADLLHGPLAMIDEDRPVVVITPDGSGARMLEPVLEQLTARNADVCVVGPREVAAKASVRIALPSGMEESLAPIAQIAPLQQLALKLALSRHHDPDRPRGLRKVTRTT